MGKLDEFFDHLFDEIDPKVSFLARIVERFLRCCELLALSIFFWVTAAITESTAMYVIATAILASSAVYGGAALGSFVRLLVPERLSSIPNFDSILMLASMVGLLWPTSILVQDISRGIEVLVSAETSVK